LHRELGNAYKILVGKPERKAPYWRTSRKEDHNTVKLDIKGVRSVDRDWINLAQYRDHWQALVNMVINLRVP